MMEVQCFLQAAYSRDVPFCTYLIPKPFKSQHIIDLFPYEGCNFYFRIKIPASAIGIKGDFVWLDVTPNLDNLFESGTLEGLFANFPLEVKVVCVDLQYNEIIAIPDAEYESYINETMLFFPQETRNTRFPVDQSRPVKLNRASSSSAASTTSTNATPTKSTSHPMMDNNTTQNSTFRDYQEDETTPSSSSSSHTSKTSNPLLNLKSVQKGATNLWKGFKGISEKIQQTPGLNFLNQDHHNNNSKRAIQTLNSMAQLLMTNYQNHNIQHTSAILKLWEITFPKDLPPPPPSNDVDLVGMSIQWKQAGWQKDHPSYDLKSSGLFAIYALIYFGDIYGILSQQMIQQNKNNTKSNYPYAIVAVNLTLLLGEVFSLRDHE
jgi:hypothetical protein